MTFDYRPAFIALLAFGAAIGLLIAVAWVALGWQTFATVAVSMAFGAYTDRFFRGLFA